MQKIALIGIGGIGKRHLQAISNLNIDYELICFDKNIDFLDFLPEFCNSNNIKKTNINMVESEEIFYNCISDETLVIIATTAKGRKGILEGCIEKRPLAIIAEKPLVQNNTDYQYIINKAKDFKTNIYINFIARAQPFWKKIHKEFKNTKFNLVTNLPKEWGIACVGIHHFDLFTWFIGENGYEIIDSSVKYVFEQKRKGFYDVAGNILISTERGQFLNVNSSENPNISSVQFINETDIYNYFEIQKKLLKLDKKNKLRIDSAEDLYISNYMTEVIINILTKKDKCILPDINESYIPHKILFEYLMINHLDDLNFT